MKNNIAIVVVAFNRKASLERLLFSLDNALYDDEVTLIISIDKSDTDIVEKYADQYTWTHGEKIVDKHNSNLGLRKHMLSLGKWFDSFDALVILEDDIVVSKHFLSFTDQCVTKYKDNPSVAGISLYSFAINYQTGLPFTPLKDQNDVYFMNCAMSWGEVWMKEQWLLFYEWYKKNQDFSFSNDIPSCLFKWSKNSWLKYHTRYCIEKNYYFVFPYTSYSTNFGDKGVHHSGYGYDIVQVPLQYGKKTLVLPDIIDDNCIVYDGFFENKSIYKWINTNAEVIVLDLNGSRRSPFNGDYLLSSKKYDYRIIRSFGLEYQPIEANVLYHSAGNDLFLYDLREVGCNKNEQDVHKFFCYYYHIVSVPLFLKRFGFKKLIAEFTKYVFFLIKSKLIK
jgi:hypothetical protein